MLWTAAIGIELKGPFSGQDYLTEFPSRRPDLQRRAADLLSTLSVRILIGMVELGAYDTSYDKLDGGDIDPGLGALDGGFEVFGQAAVAVEPGEGTFDDPAAREDFETHRIGHAADDFSAPSAEFGECFEELIARIGTVGEEVTQQGERSWMASITSGAPSRSCRSEGWIAAPTIKPVVSVTICRLRPLIFLAAS